MPAPKRTHHWQQHFQAVAPCSQRHKHARPKTHTPVYSSTLIQHPHPAAAPACPLQSAHTHNSDSSTLKQHPAAAPACPKRRHATPPILEVRTPIASLSGDKASKDAKASPIGRAATPKFKPRSPWSRRKQVDPELFLHLERPSLHRKIGNPCPRRCWWKCFMEKITGMMCFLARCSRMQPLH